MRVSTSVGDQGKGPRGSAIYDEMEVHFGGNRWGGERRKVCQAQVVVPARGANLRT